MFKKIVWLGFSSKWKNAKDVEKYIDSLIKSWASEFMTWYNPDYWYEKFGFEVSPNGRFAEHEQITDYETLKQIVEQVHKHSLEIFININAWYYTSETMPFIKRMIEEFQELKIDWIICWNIWILEYLKNIWYKWKINISTIMSIYNTQAIEFLLENYNVNKIILSREITLKEIENIVTSFPDTLFEVFGEGDFCRYNNWLCFAEHKYWVKDICTVVVNDLIIKKRFNPAFKKLLTDQSLNQEEKIEIFNDNYINYFEQIAKLLWKIELWYIDREELENELIKLIKIIENRVDLYFDALKPIEKNKNIFLVLRALKLLKREEFTALEKELEYSLKSWMKYLKEKTKQVWWQPKLKALELANFYSRWDNLNLYSYLFFDKFKNIDTVKFPTRWRNYNEKMKIIEELIEAWKIDEKYLDRWVSIERTHYDLSYLFEDKLWFRKMLNASPQLSPK